MSNGSAETRPSEDTDDEAVPTRGDAKDVRDNAKSETPYPHHDLQEAERVAVAVAEAGGTEAAEDDVLAKLNLASKTSRSYTYRLSSAKEFGLVTKSGRGDSARVALTALGRRLQMPESPLEVQAARAAAFLTPPLYQQLVQRYGGMPLPDAKGLANVLARDFAVLQSVSTIAAQAFLESARQAGWVNGNGRLQAANDVAAGTGAAQRPLGAHQEAAPLAPPQLPPEREQPGQQTLKVPADFIAHTFPLRRDLTVTIPLPVSLTRRDVKRLKSWMDALIIDDEDETTSEDK
jgi:hypothetical protein